jgi:zinc protease
MHKGFSRRTLERGSQLLFTENLETPIISTRFLFPSKIGAPGLAHLTSAVLTKGTQQHNSQELAGLVENAGAQLGYETATDYLLLSLKCLAEDFKALFTLCLEILTEANFPEDQVSLEKNVTLQGIRAQRERAFSVAYSQFREHLYGPKHPYGYSTLGTEETVTALQSQDLATYHKNAFNLERMVLSLCGGVSDELKDFVEEQVKSLPSRASDRTEDTVPEPQPTGTHRIVTPQETEQTTVLLGYAACGIHHADYPALKVLNTYLGSGLSSRLFVELREKRGLAYEVSSFFPTYRQHAHFGAYIGTAPQNVPTAEEGLRRELEQIREIPLTDEALQAAKNKTLGQYALGKQTNSQIAQLLGWYEILGVGADHDEHYPDLIGQVTADDVQRVGQIYFTEPVVSLVGPVDEEKVANECSEVTLKV